MLGSVKAGIENGMYDYIDNGDDTDADLSDGKGSNKDEEDSDSLNLGKTHPVS